MTVILSYLHVVFLKCALTIVNWMKECDYINIDDLVCERLITDFSDNKVIRSLDWLVKNRRKCNRINLLCRTRSDLLGTTASQVKIKRLAG